MMTTTRRRDNPLLLRLFTPICTAICALGATLPVAAQDLSLPRGAERSFATRHDPGAYELPIGPWQADTGLPTARVEGRISIEAWRLPGASRTPFQLIQPLRDALVAAGYDIVLDCDSAGCGGFDFRFDTLVLPAPEMFVDLTEYHFVSARLGPAAVSIMTSHDDRRSYVQIIRAGGSTAKKSQTKPDAAPLPVTSVEALQDVAKGLETVGHAVLTDVVFQSGSTDLAAGAVKSLDAIAGYLRANPNRVVLFVGHTDATGSLDANKAVSQRRAEAAMAYLINQHAIPKSQLQAQGAGYLAPIASNLTETGRRANRRVEAVLLSTQ